MHVCIARVSCRSSQAELTNSYQSITKSQLPPAQITTNAYLIPTCTDYHDSARRLLVQL